MKILHTVEFYHPSVGGMQEVARQLSERLLKFGHEVTVATTRLPGRSNNLINGVKIEEFDIKGNLASGLTGEIERYQNYLRTSDFDVITNFAAQQWATDAMISILDEIKSRKVFVPTGFSGLFTPQYEEYFSRMKQWMKQYDMSVFLSDDYRDIKFARDCGIKKIMIIPNGAAAEEFLTGPALNVRSMLGIPSSNLLILHVGSHTGIKGHAEAISIFKKARLRQATLLLVANDFGDGCAAQCRDAMQRFNKGIGRIFDYKQLLVAELPREATISAYQEADLFLFPSNIECSPLVLFECMASRTPFLTADVGNTAEIALWSQSGLVLPTQKDETGSSNVEIDGSAKILEEMARNAALRLTMAEKGFSAWEERFTWGKIAKDYEHLYLRLIDRQQ